MVTNYARDWVRTKFDKMRWSILNEEWSDEAPKGAQRLRSRCDLIQSCLPISQVPNTLVAPPNCLWQMTSPRLDENVVRQGYEIRPWVSPFGLLTKQSFKIVPDKFVPPSNWKSSQTKNFGAQTLSSVSLPQAKQRIVQVIQRLGGAIVRSC